MVGGLAARKLDTHWDENLEVLMVLQVRQQVGAQRAEVLVPVEVRAILRRVPLCVEGWMGG